MDWARVFTILMGLLLLAVIQEDSVAAVAANQDEEIRLGVTIRNRDKLDRAPSCMHTFSRVELVNQHNAEVIIKSIDFSPETTYRVGRDGAEFDNVVYSSLPRQVHASKVTNNYLSLEPGQGAIVPLTFLPRFPPPKSEEVILETLPDVLSPWQQADREQWMGSINLRSNLGFDVEEPETYKVSTMLLVETNYGMARVRFDANSVRENPYSLPDTIFFDTETSHNRSSGTLAATKQSKDFVAENGIRIMDSFWNANAAEDTAIESGPDCYDLYLKHPKENDSNMQIQEVTVSRPDSVNLQIRAWKDPDSHLITTNPQQTIRDWTGDGFLLIPPDGEQHYITTICADSEGVERDPEFDEQAKESTQWVDSPEIEGSLGFVQIRTDSETLYVSLFESGISQDEARSVRYHSAPVEEFPCSETSSQPLDSALTAMPEDLHIYLIEGTADTATAWIAINNTGMVDVNVMRTSIVFPDTDASELDLLGIEMVTEPGEPSITAGKTTFGVFTVQLSWNVSTLDLHATYEFCGTVVLQGSADYTSSDAWAKAAMLDPGLDADLTLEIPLTVRCERGKLGITTTSETNMANGISVVDDAGQPGRIGLVSALIVPIDWEAVSVQTAQIYEERAVDELFRIISTVNVSMEVNNVAITHENKTLAGLHGADGKTLCNRFDLDVIESASLEFLDLKPLDDSAGVFDVGVVQVKYFLPSDDEKQHLGNHSSVFPTKCFMRIRTEPETGGHFIPIFLFNGRVHVSVDAAGGGDMAPRTGRREDSVPAPALSQQKNRAQSLIGFPQVLDWFQRSKAGLSLRSLLSQRKSESDESMLSRYLHGLQESRQASPLDPDTSVLVPILLKVGAINPGETERFSLYITNFNPAATRVLIDVGEVEGLKIALGRDAVDRDHVLSRAKAGRHITRMNRGPFKGHPLEGLRQFLISDQWTEDFLSFGFRDAVKLSEAAAEQNPILKEIFTARPSYHKHAAAPPTQCGEPQPPQPYGKFMSSLRGRKYPGPIGLSSNSKSVRALSVCNHSNHDLVTLPAGGVARFEVTLQSPPVSYLDHDISQFLSTGLVLSTDRGDVMPVFVSFETPRGKLDISPFLGHDGLKRKHGARTIRIPPDKFSKRSVAEETAVVIPPKSRPFDGITISNVVPLSNNTKDHGVHLYMTSSFNRHIELLEVASCNPLFEVVLRESPLASNDPLLGVHIGTIRNVLPCSPLSGESMQGYRSFFSCALDWLIGRRLQYQQCGTRVSPASAVNKTYDQKMERIDFETVSQAFVRALVTSAWSMGGGRYRGQRRALDGFAPPPLIDAFAKAWHVWWSGQKTNLLQLTTNLRAVIRYNSSTVESAEGNDADPYVLSLAMGNLTIDSLLEIPSLVMHGRAQGSVSASEQEEPHGVKELGVTLDFPRTFVGEVSSVMIQVANPTSTPVKVRLAVPPPAEEFERYAGKDSFKVTNAMRREFITAHDSPYTQTGCRAQSGAEYVSQQWWDGGGSFFLGDVWGGLVRSHYNITVRAPSGPLVSLLSPGLLSNVAFISGCGERCGIRDEAGRSDGQHDVRLTSSIGASAGERTVLMGRSSRHDQSHIRFRAAGSMLTGGKGPSPFALPFFALQEEVEIPPLGRAELGPVLFRPPGKTKYMGCESKLPAARPPHCAESNFTSVVFLENSLTGLERVFLRGQADWEHVTFEDVSSSDGLDDFSDLEVRNGRDALMFSGTAELRSHGSQAVVKQLAVKNDGDVPVSFASAFLADMTIVNQKTFSQAEKVCSLGEFTLRPCLHTSIRIEPGQNFTFSVQHDPRCAQLSSFVAIILEYNREKDNENVFAYQRQHARNGAFRKAREELLVGYKMDTARFSRCVSSGGHVVFRFLDAMDKLGLKRPEQNIFDAYGMFAILAFASTYTGFILTITASGLILVRKLVRRLKTSSAFEKRLLGGTQKHNMALQLDSNWLVTLRCLSRLDPSSLDLQTLGREQTRLVLLTQSRAHNILPPLCINSSGVFQRERRNDNRHIGSKSGLSSGGSERVRTLSDAFFKSGNPCCVGGGGLVSFGAGWKTALSRGIINDFSLRRFKVDLLTERLLNFRSENPALLPDELEEIESSTSAENEADPTETFGHDEHVVGIEQSGHTLLSQDRRTDADSDSSSEDEEDEVSDRDFDKKVSVSEQKKLRSVGDTNRSSSSLQDPSSLSYQSETAEYTKVLHKGKLSKKSGKLAANKPESSSKALGGAAASVGAKPVGAKSDRSSAQCSPGSTKIIVQPKQSLRKTTSKPQNGKLSARAAPFEPKPNEVGPGVSAPDGASAKKPKGTELQAKAAASQPKPALRPPPGLAPPPGFEDASSAELLASKGATGSLSPSQKAVSSGDSSSIALPPPPANPPTLLLDDPLAAAVAGSTPSSLLTSEHDPIGALLGGPPSPPPRASHSHQNTGDGFDIMDFLDGILTEGVHAGDEQDGAASNDSSTLLPHVPANPWAAAAAEGGGGGGNSDEFKSSRATIYGISFDDETGGESAGAGMDLPVLTPSAILDGQSSNEEDNDNLHASFYSSLLK